MYGWDCGNVDAFLKLGKLAPLVRNVMAAVVTMDCFYEGVVE